MNFLPALPSIGLAMKSIFFATSLLVLTGSTVTLVKAETVWLLLREEMAAPALQAIPTKNMAQCQSQGRKYVSSYKLGYREPNKAGYECLQGK